MSTDNVTPIKAGKPRFVLHADADIDAADVALR